MGSDPSRVEIAVRTLVHLHVAHTSISLVLSKVDVVGGGRGGGGGGGGEVIGDGQRHG